MLIHSKVILRLIASWSLQTSMGIPASISYEGGPLPSTIQRLTVEHPAQVMAFDILALNDADIRKESLLIRKQLLRNALGKNKRVAFVDFVEKEGKVLFGVTEELRLEGVMAKRCDSIYRASKTRDWLKIKTAIKNCEKR